MFRLLVIQVKNETSPWFFSIPPSCATFSFLDQNCITERGWGSLELLWQQTQSGYRPGSQVTKISPRAGVAFSPLTTVWWLVIQNKTKTRTKKYPICPLLDPHSPQGYHPSDVWCDGFISLLKITSSSLKERAQTREAIKDMYILVRNYESPPSIKDIVNDILYIFSHRIIPTTMFYIMVSFRGSPCFPRNGI